MPMSHEEATRAFATLAVLMREAGFQWVLQEVDDRLTLGKVTVVRMSKTDLSAPGSLFEQEPLKPARQGTKEAFVRSDEYTPSERLCVLVDALMLAVPAINGLAESTLLLLGEAQVDGETEVDHRLALIRFAPETQARESLTIGRSEFESRKRSTEALMALLAELKAEAGSAGAS